MSILNEIAERILSTPEIANQIKKSLVNRDLALEIDGKRYQITTRSPTTNDLENLKAEIWDLRKALKKIIDAHASNDNVLRSSCIKSAEVLLKKL